MHIKNIKLWPIYVLVLLCVLSIVYVTDKTATVMSDTSSDVITHTVIIDAGHGGVDGGSTSCTGILESTLNLQIALRLNDLMNLLGYDTKMVRTTDISVYTQGETIAAKKVSDLKARVKMVNETSSALLISIHQNYYGDSQYSGAQVFYPPIQGSELLAKTMQASFREFLNPGSRRQAKRSTGIYLMENINCIGVLIECGFLSNPEEEAKLRSDDYQKKLCAVISCTIAGFLS